MGIIPDENNKSSEYLYVNINVVKSAFNILFVFNRLVYLESGGKIYHTPGFTWYTGRSGTHAGDYNYIMQSLEEMLEEFLNEYLKVNQK
ncbi:MAG: hypothetical protein A2Y94_09345 [Caldithrix sp. RBG_13_44_9]|nr:MAG: hypothetical protein A2Y94_09345 [Caldithrix sp. RBG_13_44_9]